jgi:hypothetical protein
MYPVEWAEIGEQLRALDVAEAPKPGVLLMMGKQNYRSEVRHLTMMINQFVKWLDSKGKLQDTVVILLSDHGEGFFEHNLVGHNNSLYQELIHVPLIIRFPDGKYGGTRVQSPVRTVDLLPTILDYAGIPHPGNIDGVSLLQYCRDDRTPTMPSLSSHYLCHAVISWPYKLILSRRAGDSALFDLSTDPGETNNILHELSTGLIDSLAQPVLRMARAGEASYIITLTRSETSDYPLVLAGQAMREAEIWFRDTNDEVSVEPNRIEIKLGASVFSRMIIVHPFASLPKVSLAGGKSRDLAEGSTRVGNYELLVERLENPRSQRATKENDRLMNQLEALGYVE